MQGLIWPSISFILGIAVLSVLYVGGQDAIRGELSIGALVQFVAYLYLLQMPMINIGWISNMFQAGWASLGRLQEIFNAVPKITDPIDPVTAPIRGDVEFRGVSFAYGQTIELHDVSFKVPAGGSLAIVGPTGAGKSTVVNLIPRLCDVQQGEILIDGISVTRRPLEQLRRAIGYVPQETFLFSVPLRENVGFGLDEALTDPQLDWAGDVSQLNKDIEDFPARYDTMIGERGVTLSGGQKQRAAIARAVAKDPRILILDDALSAVDTYTEAEILRRLRGVMRERTSIVVAHRISAGEDADEMLVLGGGRGNFDEDELLGKAYDARLMRRLLGYLRPYRGLVIIALLIILGISVTEAAPPVLAKFIVDNAIAPAVNGQIGTDEGLARLAPLGIAYIAVLLLSSGLRYAQTMLASYVGQKAMYDLRVQLFAHLQSLSLTFFDHNPVGRLMTRITNDIDALIDMVTQGVVAIFGDIVVIGTIAIVLLVLDFRLALVTFAALPLLIWLTMYFRRIMRDSFRSIRIRLARINAYLNENLSGMAIVQLFTRERVSFRQFDNLNTDLLDANRGQIRAMSMFFPAVGFTREIGRAHV